MLRLVLTAHLLAVNAVAPSAADQLPPAPRVERAERAAASGKPATTASADAAPPARQVELRAPMAPFGPRLSPPLVRRDRGMFQGGELAAAGGGALLGDVAVLGAGYLTLRLFANGTFEVTASNMRTAAYALAVSALVVPPLLSSALAAWARRGPGDGAWWKSFLLASAGQVAALAAGWFLSPAFWVILPVQLAVLPLASSAGLHWGPSRAADPGGLADPPPDAAADSGARAPGLVHAFATSPPACPAG